MNFPKTAKKYWLVLIILLNFFTPTVNAAAATPTPTPTITVSAPTGTIYACAGSASVSPNVQQFTVSGSSLTGDINVTAPAGFEISTDLNNGYASTLILPQSGGILSNTTIYVRSAATAAAGSLTGQVSLTSPDVTAINTPVQATVGEATVNAVQPQAVTNGLQTQATYFTGTATSYNWVNDTPAIGLAASGSGNIDQFAAINTGNNPIIATITVTPLTYDGGNVTCTGAPITFTITVNPSPKSEITAEGYLQPLITTYGTPSSSAPFNISGTGLTEGILVTPPAGFEVSTDDLAFTKTLTFGVGGDISSTLVYIRLAANTPVGNYPGNIVLSSGSLAPVNIPVVGMVYPTMLTITADNKSKAFGAENPVLTANYTGFVNNEGTAQLAIEPLISTTAITTSPAGTYPIIVSGGSSASYTFVYVDGVLTVYPPSLIIPNTFTPNGDGINDTWDIKYLENYPNCKVDIFNRYGERLYSSIGYPVPWDGKYKGANLPVGTYYYIIDTKNGLKTFAGYVTIIR